MPLRLYLTASFLFFVLIKLLGSSLEIRVETPGQASPAEMQQKIAVMQACVDTPGRRLSYGAHFVFSLHMHAFWFFAMLVLTPLPRTLVLAALPLLALHSVLALRHVYHGRWAPALGRALVIALAYGLLLALATELLLLGAVWLR
jgi:hypothetical protein